MDDCAALLAEAARAAGTTRVPFPRQDCRSVRRAGAADRGGGFRAARRHRSAGDGDGGQGDRDALAAAAKRAGVAIAADDTWGDIFSRVLAERIEPHLGIGRATILYEYPLPLAALARAKPGSDAVAERFELYACGVELANAFGELTDAAEQRRASRRRWTRKSASMASAIRSTRISSPRSAHMPQACGIALGFDRLVMLATGAERIEQVIWTPVVEPDMTQGRCLMTTLRTPAQFVERGLVPPNSAPRWRRSPRATRWRCRRRWPR